MKFSRTINISHLLLTASAILILFAGASCSSSRKASSVSTASGQTAVRTIDTRNILSVMAADYQPWQSVYSSFKLRLSSPLSFSFSGRATMVRDRSLHLSLRVLGMEMAVLHADTDSLWLVDKLHKVMCAMPLASLTDRTGITLGNVQDILLGQAFYPGEAQLAKAPFKVEVAPLGYTLSPAKKMGSIDWAYTVTPTPELAALDITTSANAQFRASFSDFLSTVAGRAASDIAIDATVKNKKVNAEIIWDLAKAEWNGSRSDSWTVPASGYKRLTLTQLLTAVKQL